MSIRPPPHKPTPDEVQGALDHFAQSAEALSRMVIACVGEHTEAGRDVKERHHVLRDQAARMAGHVLVPR